MIGKIVKGKTFGGCVKYVLGKEKAYLLDTNLLSPLGNDLKQSIPGAIRELNRSKDWNSRVKVVCAHHILSVPPAEKLSDEVWREIIPKYLERMGFTENQYIAVKHQDTDHNHVHIIASRIKLDGELVRDSWDWRKAETVIRELEKEFGLQPVECSWEVKRDRANLTRGEQKQKERTGDEPVKVRLQDAIDLSISNCNGSLSKMVKLLSDLEIETAIRKTRNGIIQGISFKLDGVSFPGNKLGSDYSYGRLVERVGIAKEHETDCQPLEDFEKDALIDKKDLELLNTLRKVRVEGREKIKQSKTSWLEL
jgi:hypothetical protein